MRIFLGYLIALMILGSVPLLAQTPLVLQNEADSYEVKNYLTVLEDSAKNIQFEQLYQASYQQRFKPFAKKVLSFGNSRSVFWLQFKVKNMTKERWVVAVERSYIDCQRDSLGLKNYQHLLRTIQATTFDEQKKLLLQSLQQHQGHEPQRDDITVVGVEV